MRVVVAAMALLVSIAAARADPLDDARAVLSHEIANAKSPADVMLIDITEAGHVVLGNGAGERFTASNKAEVRRGFAALGRSVGQTGSAGHVFVTARAAFDQWKVLRDIPAAKMEMVDKQRFGLTLRPDGTPLISTAAGPAEVDAATTLRALQWHLLRPLGAVRVLALEPGGPQSLTRSINRDVQSGDPLIDAIDPQALAAALPTLRGQIAVITGKVVGGKLTARGSSGTEASIEVATLRAAAANAGVAVILRHGTSGAQPHTPRYRLLRRDPSGPPQYLGEFVRATLPSARFAARTLGDGSLDVTGEPTKADLLDAGRWMQAVADMLKPIYGETAVERLAMWLPAPDVQRELDRRVIKAVPSWLQYGYVGLLLLGLLGLPVARRWFARLWPDERRDDYAGSAGFHAARAARAVVFAVVFMPLAAIFSAPASLYRLVSRRA